jgi:hypothetical protein
MRIFLKYPQFTLKSPKFLTFYSETFVEKSHYYSGPIERLGDWPSSLSLPNRRMRVKWNRGPGVTPLILNHRRFFLYPCLLTLSKQSTQAVQVLKNNSSYGLVWTKDIVNSYYYAHVIWVPMILIFNMH